MYHFSSHVGDPGYDYPILGSIPDTGFICPGNGVFVDYNTRCQVCHFCQDGFKQHLLCPNGTLFHRDFFLCLPWYEVDCVRPNAEQPDFTYVMETIPGMYWHRYFTRGGPVILYPSS